MNAFCTRKIRNKPRLQLFKKIKACISRFLQILSGINKKQKSYFLGFILIILALFIVIKVITGIFNIISDFDPRNIALALGTELKKDKNGYVNIILLGDGGHNRAGADLMDTIIVASLDFKNKSISMLSVPRDYFVKSKKYGMLKINSFFVYNKNELGADKAYEIYPEVLGEMLNLDIKYYLRIDFNAFVEVVDSLGGITIDVKKEIYDPFYPNNADNGYTVFQIKPGVHIMDGETALKFARSRKTTSDFDRSARQQQILMAMREKALSGDVLSSPSTIKKLYQSVSNNINTNMSVREMLSIAAFAKNFNKDHLISKIIHDDYSREGGFLSVPDRTLYNEQYVLVPQNSMDIQRYANLIFNKREIFTNPAKIEVLNASSKSGIANITEGYLHNFGFNVTKTGNYLDEMGKTKKIDKSFISYNKEVTENGKTSTNFTSTVEALADFVQGNIVTNNKKDANQADISIVLGADHKLLIK